MRITKIKVAFMGGLCAISAAILGIGPGASAVVPGVNTLVSANAGGTAGANYYSDTSFMSADGKFVTFQSYASDLVNEQNNAKTDVFVRRLSNNVTTTASVSTSGVISNGTSTSNAISRTGRYVVFNSNASNLIDGSTIVTNGKSQLYVRDTKANTTTLLSKNSAGDTADASVYGLDVSSDGRFVLFMSQATNLGPVVTNTDENLYMLDRSTNEFEILNRASDGSISSLGGRAMLANMSCDGALVVFHGFGMTSDPTSGIDTYLLDRRDGNKLTNLTAAHGGGYGGDISCNGDYVNYFSYANNIDPTLTATPTNLHPYVYDRVKQTFHLVDQATDGTIANENMVNRPGFQGNNSLVEVSDNGKVVFASTASNLVSANNTNYGIRQIYIRDLETGTTELVSKDSSNNYANGGNESVSISYDGRLVSYVSQATNLVGIDTDNKADVYTSKTE